MDEVSLPMQYHTYIMTNVMAFLCSASTEYSLVYAKVEQILPYENEPQKVGKKRMF